MTKKIVAFVAIMVAVFAFNSSLVKVSAQRIDNPADNGYFCHYGQAVTNPYQVKPFGTNYSEIDGQGNNDHSQHDGPVATSPEVAQDLKNQHIQWGDIIPPVPGILPNGLNWTTEGQEIYYNECDYGEVNLEQPFITFDVTCPTVVGGKVQVVLTNEGYADGTATVNGTLVEVEAGETVTLEFEIGQAIEIVIKQRTVYNQTPVCVGGRGGDEDPQTPAVETAQVVAPKAGVNAGGSAVALLALLGASIASLAFGVVKLRKAGL